MKWDGRRTLDGHDHAWLGGRREDLDEGGPGVVRGGIKTKQVRHLGETLDLTAGDS